MNICHKQYSFPSETGLTDIFMQSITPADKKTVRGVISIVHGMAEHSDRYLDIAKYLSENGFAVFMHDHAGHGRSIENEEDLGYFGTADGNEKITDDVLSAVKIAKKEYPDVPVILWGHSMGSFITRRFIAKYPDIADAAVICGTSGANPAAGAGIAVAKLICKIAGSRHRSSLLDTMAFGSYNKNFKGNTGFEWLSVNTKNIDDYVRDDKCGYKFTAGGFKDLFALLQSVSGKEWFEAIPKSLPLYLIAGDADPVGNYGKGVTQVYENLKKSGHENVSIKLYKGLRHEIHNESCRNKVLDDIIAFAEKIIK